MAIIALANLKGGVGKSTLAVNIAGVLERLAEDPRMPHAKADVEALRAARDLLASEAA